MNHKYVSEYPNMLSMNVVGMHNMNRVMFEVEWDHDISILTLNRDWYRDQD